MASASVVLLACACGTGNNRASLSAGATSASTFKAAPSPIPSRSYAIVDPFANIANQVQSQRLATAINARDTITLKPADTTYQPRTTSTQALAAATTDGPPVPANAGSEQSTFLASLTDSVMQRDGSTGPLYTNVPVWVVLYHDVQDPVGPAGPAGAAAAKTAYMVNIVSFVNADTGAFLYSVTDTLKQPVS